MKGGLTRRLGHREIQRLFQEGKFLKGGWLHLILLPNGGGITRFGCLLRRKVVSSAVFRNQLKRWIREAFRRNEKQFPPGLDLLAVVIRLPEKPSFEMVQETLLELSLGFTKLFP